MALNAKTGAPVWTTSVIGAGTYGEATGAESEPVQTYSGGPASIRVVLSGPPRARCPGPG